ncbi:hypothetical protein [Actinomyces israelii]|uniref:hypothetical protein n=1 Tax=Actinomyces israelii TaxID=1659 RepID=UPI0023567085|nr:hypothetical protein [Actinomyces israelii]
MTTENKARSSAYYLIMVLAVMIGVVLGIGIFVWIISNVTGRARIPYLLLALPTILLVALVRFIDGALVKRQQESGGLDNQDMAPLVSPYGQAQQPGPFAYGQAQQPMPGSSSGHGQPAPTYGWPQQPGVPAYDQTPQAGTQLSYSQNGPQVG